jgi:hypothetical protein
MPRLIEISAAAQEAGVRLTPQAHALTKVVIEAITVDPHRVWRTRTGYANVGVMSIRRFDINT